MTIFPPVLAEKGTMHANLAMQQKICFEAGGLAQTQSSAEVAPCNALYDPYRLRSAANWMSGRMIDADPIEKNIRSWQVEARSHRIFPIRGKNPLQWQSEQLDR
jgi:hypothetical protein